MAGCFDEINIEIQFNTSKKFINPEKCCEKSMVSSRFKIKPPLILKSMTNHAPFAVQTCC